MDKLVQHVNPEFFAGVYLKEKQGEMSKEESMRSTFKEFKVQMRCKTAVKIAVKVVINSGLASFQLLYCFFACLFVFLFVVVELLLFFFGKMPLKDNI